MRCIISVLRTRDTRNDRGGDFDRSVKRIAPRPSGAAGRGFGRRQDGSRAAHQEPGGHHRFAVAGPLLLLAYIGVFGDHFYPMIPEQIGGGRPRVVQLLVASNAVPAVRELGLDVAAEEPVSPPVALLWEGEQAMIVRLPPPRERTVVQLSRGLVDGVVTGAVVSLPEDGTRGVEEP